MSPNIAHYRRISHIIAATLGPRVGLIFVGGLIILSSSVSNFISHMHVVVVVMCTDWKARLNKFDVGLYYIVHTVY